MTEKEKEEIKKLEAKICDHLRRFNFIELRETFKLNGQQIVKIKRGESVHFYAKTLVRLRKLVENK